MKIEVFTPAEMADRFATLVDSPVESDTSAREAELGKMSKAELVELLITAEAKGKRSGVTVQDIARAMLSDEDCLAVNYETIAQAIRLMVPGAQTSSKSIASYVSKKKDEWDLPPRYMIRTKKVEVEPIAE